MNEILRNISLMKLAQVWNPKSWFSKPAPTTNPPKAKRRSHRLNPAQRRQNDYNYAFGYDNNSYKALPEKPIGYVPVTADGKRAYRDMDTQRDRELIFSKSIVPHIRKNELGVSDLPEEEQATFMTPRKISVINDWYLPASGRYNFDNGVITLNRAKFSIPKDVAVTLAHEDRHRINSTGVPRIPKSSDILDDIYGFRNVLKPIRAADEELHTTNAEHQYNVYNSLSNQLGRHATPEEYEQYIRNMDHDTLLRFRERPEEDRNGYEEVAGPQDTKNKLELYRQALLGIVSNSSLPRAIIA